ncbi:MAG: 50S ribosomal protein L17 [Saprospirales bacterium]|jgi:large subunit ribosomal protein L17|nr:50S ribosomal protein L17 [Saprospirales bacterium]MBK6905058.1 50S ribosomal protein L17 [Saprospirales bacterium]MBK7335280.1 50S ribosomal protein L17 [Saprospirales bacterium]
MRHGNKVNHLGRTTEHRKALLRNLAIALIEHKRIRTTLAKARSLRTFIEPIITKSKENTTHSRRVVFSYLQNKEAIKELFSTVAEKVGDRPGGYVRVIKTGFRRGDAAEMAMIELVDFNEVYSLKKTEQEDSKKKRTRRGGSGAGAAKTAATAAVAAPTVETAVEEAMDVEEETTDAAPETPDTEASNETEEKDKEEKTNE